MPNQDPNTRTKEQADADESAAISAETGFALAPHVFTREFEGELVVLDLAGGDYFGLDMLGRMLWEGLLSGRTISDIARAAAPHYEVPADVLESDLHALAADLVARKLLVPRASGSLPSRE